MRVRSSVTAPLFSPIIRGADVRNVRQEESEAGLRGWCLRAGEWACPSQRLRTEAREAGPLALFAQPTLLCCFCCRPPPLARHCRRRRLPGRRVPRSRPQTMSSPQESPQHRHNNNNNPPPEGTPVEPGLNSECLSPPLPFL